MDLDIDEVIYRVRKDGKYTVTDQQDANDIIVEGRRYGYTFTKHKVAWDWEVRDSEFTN